ncbi:MAG: hypothetical protein PHI23_03615 [Candidatus Peribacteraceae bacterium]|nr:hypothetical protein [Candidatus Peribacteraceae bacterium]
MGYLLAIPAIVWLLLSALFFACGEYLSKQWGMDPRFSVAFAVVAVDAIGTFLWLPAILHKNQLAIMGTAWLLIGTLATVSVGIFFFGETLTTGQWTGIVLAVAALWLLGVA